MAAPPRLRLARSYLFAPGNRSDLLGKVFAAGADAVVLDLEEAVPRAQKERSRDAVAGAVAGRAGASDPAVWVRINSLDGEHWTDDVAAVVRRGLAGLRIPKADSHEALARLDDAVSAAEEKTGIPAGTVLLALTIETAAGALAAPRLAGTARVAHLTFGAADYAADVGTDPEEPLATLWARSRLVAASAAARIAPPVAPVHTRLDDAEGLRRTSHEARALGFFGRSCIHPRQVPGVHEVFTPSPQELARALEVVRALETAGVRGSGAIVVGGRFVDEAVARRARALLELADGLGLEATRG